MSEAITGAAIGFLIWWWFDTWTRDTGTYFERHISLPVFLLAGAAIGWLVS